MRESTSIALAHSVRPLFTACLALAAAFTFNCSGDDSGGGGDSSSSVGSSSSGGSSSSAVCTSWSEGEVTTAPTCGKEGVKTLTCTSGISETKTEPIAKLPITSTQFCYEGKIGEYCGSRTETFDPDLYKCEAGGKIYLKATVSHRGKEYKAVLIGTQTWLASNLNYAGEGNDKGSCYADNDDNCTEYGRLYDWETAKTVCPSGWHLPTDAEWTALTDAVGSDAGTKLKANSSLWSTNTGTDDYGFSALPGGFGSSGYFSNVGYFGYWWSATEGSASNAYGRRMGYSYAYVYRDDTDKTYLYSVRCAKD